MTEPLPDYLRELVPRLALPKPTNGAHTPPTVKHAKLIASIAKGFAPSIAEYVAAEIAKAVLPLQKRISELEAQTFEYRGVHEIGAAYRKNHFVTSGGSLWAARCNTTSTPGVDGTWQLAVKRGKDGADAPAAREVRSVRSHR